jgi:hypothetical protein
MTAITDVAGASAAAGPTKASPGTPASGFSDLLAQGPPSSSAAAGANASGSLVSPQTQSALVSLQASGIDANGDIQVTTLSGQHSRINVADEQQFLQGLGHSFAQSMDVNGDGTVTSSELVGKMTSNGGITESEAQTLWDRLSPNGQSETDAQLAAAATSLFAPPGMLPAAAA